MENTARNGSEFSGVRVFVHSDKLVLGDAATLGTIDIQLGGNHKVRWTGCFSQAAIDISLYDAKRSHVLHHTASLPVDWLRRNQSPLTAAVAIIHADFNRHRTLIGGRGADLTIVAGGDKLPVAALPLSRADIALITFSEMPDFSM